MPNKSPLKTTLTTAFLSLAAFSLGLAAFSPRRAHAQIGDAFGLSPYWDWKTIETEHFRLTFPKELSQSAQKAANYFEEAHSILSPKLKWTPHYKTQILLVDNADAANGLTSPVGRFGILLYLTPPDNWFSTQYYDDWLRLLILHEYTHLLNMDTTLGLWQVLRYAVGDVLLPNAVWPGWMLEGLAVYMETRYTGLGRGRSPYYEMVLRTAVAEGVLNDPSFITLDKINGPNPYYPYGETAYLFGYQAWNQIAQLNIGMETADGASLIPPGTKTHPGENMLGEDSYRSGGRIPYFINGNLENISGKDWYTFWKEWVEDTRKRAFADLAKIRSQPLSRVKRLTHGGGQTLGSAFSPNGKWIAYTRQTSDEVNSLWIQERTAQARSRQVYDKILGSSVAFTPDSKTVVFSTLNRKGVYYLWSDLKAYSVEDDRSYSLTDSMRARDPDVSRDGKWVTFTITRDGTTGLAIAPLMKDGRDLKLGQVKILFFPTHFDAIHTPKFSSDGKRIYFSWHRNGQSSQEICALDRDTNQVSTLVSNGKMNRFPAVRATSAGDELYFESDLTGVQNIYLHRPSAPLLVTNTISGFEFPAFDSHGTLFANVYSSKGWDLAEVELHPFNASVVQDVTVAPPPAPSGPEATPHPPTETHPIEDYSIFPSIWPRQWLPVLFADRKGVYVGGQVLGFDAVDRHRYVLGVAYDSFVHQTDVLATYSNRSFGPDLTFLVDTHTSGVTSTSNDELLSYSRKLTYTADARFPIQWTYSTLTPIVSLNEERTIYHAPGANPGGTDDVIGKSFWVPYVDTRLVLTEAHNSLLAISQEEGRYTEVGSRVYFNSGSTFLKTLLRDTEYRRTDFLMEHSVLVPSLAYQWVNRTASSGYLDTNVTVEGRQTGRLLNTLPGQSLDQLVLRGYPLRTIYSKQAAIGSLDYRFPLIRIFRGLGTNPAFFENLHGFVFGESAYFPTGTKVKALPSAGAGIQLDTTLLNTIPLTASTEYHKGFREDFGGTGELFFQINVASPLSY